MTVSRYRIRKEKGYVPDVENLTTAVLLLVKSAVKKKFSRNAGMNRMVSALSVITNQPQSINSVKFAL